DWRGISDFAGIGYPILEAEPDGSAVVTKHKGTGGRVSVAGITEQLVYEIGDPRSYITPDCIVDFTTARLEHCGPDRVRLSRSRDKSAVDRFTKEIAPLALNGPPVVTYVGGRPKVEEVVAYWPALIPKTAVQAAVSVEEG